ncbi:MAG: dihydropteroate synthase [Nitrospirota bacterium]|jgi:dihydropteroate synthase
MRFSWRGYTLDFSLRTLVMGVLNVTPDSFSDGGDFFDPRAAIGRARQIEDEGADAIDIGGLSTRPGSEPVDEAEELRRVLPVIEALAGTVSVPLSIDTYRASVARRALEAGAAMVNDISGLRFDPEMSAEAARAGVPVVVMHIRGTPRNMQAAPRYEALVPEVMDYLRGSIRLADEAGIAQVIIDPGIGFGKTFDHNLEIINRLGEFTLLGRPVLVGPSRKAFLGRILGGAPPKERLMGTAAAVTAAVLAGAHMVRVHDVREMVQVARVADAIKRERMTLPGA